MFTGIVEEIGKIVSIRRGAKSSVLQIEGNCIFQDLKIGDSVAVNGVCLTVTQMAGHSFFADVMSESLRRSSLGELKPNSPVNLERAMAANGRFGGHMVSGHIDGTGVITKIEREDNAVWFTIQASGKILRYVVEKGSIAMDGISLTVAGVSSGDFQVSVIPHTLCETILGVKGVGSVVNLENDLVGKYIERFLEQPKEETLQPVQTGITMEFLAKAGF